MRLAALARVAVLGSGSFGTVDLVRLPLPQRESFDGFANPLASQAARAASPAAADAADAPPRGFVSGAVPGFEHFALKRISRARIAEEGLEHLAANERAAMLELSAAAHGPAAARHAGAPFLLALYATFEDASQCYLLLEPCVGGDVFGLMRALGPNAGLGVAAARFATACCAEALSACDARDIVFRDLKPENMMVSAKGYVKVADFGLAKKTLRTFTMCGTPEYLAPEIILCRGHNAGADWWALGVCAYELLAGATPFFARDPCGVYELIIAASESPGEALYFPEEGAFDADAEALCRALMHPERGRRLGYGHAGVAAVKAHAWFTGAGFDWAALEAGALASPLVPDAAAVKRLLLQEEEQT